MKHLEENNETYMQHLRKAMYFSGCLLVGSCGSFIHALLPCILKESTSKVIQHVRSIMIIQTNNNFVLRQREKEENETL